MPAYNIRELQKSILPILMNIDRVCKEHGLRYYIAAGTMLGAVRHGGFIPWDDDLDIAMPRKDYELLMANHKEWVPAPYEIIAYETDEKYPFPFGKMQDASTTLIERAHMDYIGGIYIDIFPIDGMTSNPLKQRLYLLHYAFLKKVQYFLFRDPYRHGHGPSCWIPLLCRKFYTLKEVQRKMKEMQKRYDFEECELCIDHDFGKKGIMQRAFYGTPENIKFEGEDVNGMAKPDAYLTKLYGNYMQIPPGPKQKQHNFHLLDLTMPYKMYKD